MKSDPAEIYFLAVKDSHKALRAQPHFMAMFGSQRIPAEAKISKGFGPLVCSL